jgi:RNA polymerase sigma-70 factor (ECF subfamily)
VTETTFKSIFDTHFDSIRRYLYYRSGDASLSTDLAQDTFMRVWEKNLDLDPHKDIGLLYKIAGDLFISHYRRDKLARRALREVNFEILLDSPHELMEAEQLKAVYKGALANLSEPLRVVFLMSRMEELTYTEIAQRLSLSVKAVEKRMSKALTQLRKTLIEQ